MTREEIIDGLEIYTVGRLNKDKIHITVEELQKFIDEIKTLEQEPILDKIRAEITDWQTDIHDNEYDAEAHDFVFERIYEIIDEYVAESEGKQ